MMALILAALVLLPPLFAQRRAGVTWLDAMPGAFAWAWANLVVTANLLSPFDQLHNVPAYAGIAVALSVAGAFAILRLSRCRRIEDAEGILQVPPPPPGHSVLARVIFAAAMTFLGVAFVWNSLVALTINPANPDSLMYRLPRIWWYLGQGNLRHFAEHVDPRVVFYPFNVVLAGIPLALFEAPPVAFNLLSVAAWAVVAVTTFRFVQTMGCARHLAASVAFLIALAPIVLVEATSTNDEIIAGAGVLVGVYFGFRYLLGGSRLDLATGALALGCGLGSKLHFFFFWPAILLLGGWLALAAARSPAIRRYLGNFARLRDVAMALVLAGALSIPFLVYNRLSSPNFAYSGDEARNSPFSLRVATQTLSLLTGQLFLSSFPTIDNSPRALVRQRRIDDWNAWWNAHVFADIDQSRDFMFVSYRFRGVTDPMAGMHFENTEWAGFLPWLMVACGVVIIGRRDPRDWLPAALGLSLLAWWVSYGFTMKYFDTVGVYFAYPLVICGPFLAAGLRLRPGRLVTWGMAVLAGVVAAGHLALGQQIILFNVDHSLRRVVEAVVTGKPIDASKPRFGLNNVLRKLDRTTLVATHWAVPYYEIIKTAPGISYGLNRNSETASGPKIIPVQANPVFDGYIPIKVNLPADQGLVYLDTILCSYGPELIFGDAPSFHDRLTRAKSRYLVFQARVDETEPAARKLIISNRVLGAATRADSLRYRVAILEPGKVAAKTEWSPAADASFPIGDEPSDRLSIRIEVADADGKVIGVTTCAPFLPAPLKRYQVVEP